MSQFMSIFSLKYFGLYLLVVDLLLINFDLIPNLVICLRKSNT